MVHVALRRAEGEIGRRAYVLAMAALLVLQAGLSTELLADTVVIGAFTLISARFVTGVRRSVDRVAAETIAAGALAIVVASPLLYYALFSGTFPKGAPGLSDVYGLDLLNPFFPTYATWLGRNDFLSLGVSYVGGNVTEAGGYLSLPLIGGFLCWCLCDARGRPLARLIGLVTAFSVLLALGSHLHVAGHQTVALPYNWMRNLPIADNVLPVRIFLFTTLAVAIGVADWLAQRRAGAAVRWLVIGLGALLLLPNIIRPLYGVAPRDPSFFRTSLHRRYLDSGATVLALPFGANDVSMLWQAEAGFSFYMPEGYISGVIPSPFNSQVTVGQLEGNLPTPASALGSFIREHHVTDVVVDPAAASPWPTVLAQLRLHARPVGGILLYKVSPERK